MKIAFDSTVIRGVLRGISGMRIFAGPVLLLCLWVNTAAQADESVAVGRAYGVDNGALLYTESHRWDDQHHSVQYFYPDGELFAISELDFSHSFISPAYTQSYPQSGRWEGARWDGDKLILFNARREQSMRYEQPLVISAGFFHFIRAHWDELLEGKTVTFEFAVPDRMTIVTLRARHLPATESAITDGDPQWTYFRVEAVNRMVRWLSTPLEVAFDSQRRLMVLRGTSIVKLEKGATPVVIVHYDYDADAAAEQAPAPAQ